MRIIKIAFDSEIIKNIIKGLDLSKFQRVDGLEKLDSESHRWEAEASLEALGGCYIAVNYAYWENQFVVERYYENEFLNDEWGKSFKIPVDMDNLEQTVSIINNKIKTLMV